MAKKKSKKSGGGQNGKSRIDGEVIKDVDAWLLANADDTFLHQEGRWDLIEQRRLGKAAAAGNDLGTKAIEPRKLPIDIDELENALELVRIDFGDEPAAYLDLSTGRIVVPEMEEEFDEEEEGRGEFWENPNWLSLPSDLRDYGHPTSRLEDYVRSLEPGPVRDALEKVRPGKGAFRKFKDIIFGSGDVAAKDAWHWFETKRRREMIVEWLEIEGIEPDWGQDIFAHPHRDRTDKRPDLLKAVLQFVRDARGIEGVRRIALLGSLTTDKPIPKDVDLLVEIDDDLPLAELARRKRQLLGKTMQTGDSCGADVFICNPNGDYLGRLCSYRECGPRFRVSCQAQHCGHREYLCDDLPIVTLDRALVSEPPLELWPEVVARVALPEDVRRILVEPLP